MPDIMHPVTGAGMTVDEDDLDTYLESGWVDSTPYEFKDNSWAAVNSQEEPAQEEAPAEEAPKAAVAPKQSKTTAAAGVKGDAGPS
jgi:hypothetical protein